MLQPLQLLVKRTDSIVEWQHPNVNAQSGLRVARNVLRHMKAVSDECDASKGWH
jgi:hypothetical protein